MGCCQSKHGVDKSASAPGELPTERTNISVPIVNQEPEFVPTHNASIVQQFPSVSNTENNLKSTETVSHTVIPQNTVATSNGTVSQMNITPTKTNSISALNTVSVNSHIASPIKDSRGEELKAITPNVGYVIKTKHVQSGEKIFINMLYHELVDKALPCAAQTSTDKKGEKCLAYSVVIPARMYQASYAYDSPEINKLSTDAIYLINGAFGVQLDLDYKIPKMKRGFVGDSVDDVYITVKVDPSVDSNKAVSPPSQDVPVVSAQRTEPQSAASHAAPTSSIAPVPVVSQTPPPAIAPQPMQLQTAAPTAAAAASPPVTTATTATPTIPAPLPVELPKEITKPVVVKPAIVPVPRAVPPKMHGWLKKRGHIVLSWKSRYFVLDNGYLTYYVDKLEVPPFGRDMKGQLCLAGYREKEITPATATNNTNGKRGSTITPAEAAQWANRIHLVYDSSLFADENGGGGSGSGGDENYQDLLLEASNSDEKSAWLAAIQAHTEYFEASLVMVPIPALKGVQSTQSLNGEGSSSTPPPPDQTGSDDDDQDSVPTVMKRVSITSAAAATGSTNNGRSQSISPSRSSLYSVVDDKKRWAIFLHAGEDIVLTGLCGKPNPVGLHLMRQVVLTSRKRMLYIDGKTMDLKGEIHWTSDPVGEFPSVKEVDKLTFEVSESAKKVYKFIVKDHLTAADWVQAIASISPPQPMK